MNERVPRGRFAEPIAATIALVVVTLGLSGPVLLATENLFIHDVPDYAWYGGCFGTATGNLFGFWDRNGLPDLYVGPTGSGTAPLTSGGANHGILSLWMSKAGRDGRPAEWAGHEDDYWVGFDSTAADPYLTAGRPEHSPDCTGDFIGLSQRKWRTLGGECEGNLDGYSFNFFDPTGARRVNYTPEPLDGTPVPDIQSGIREFARYRGYESDSFSQLADFNPLVPSGTGFTFDDMRAEIAAGYPVLVFMQAPSVFSRPVGNMPFANPPIHALLVFGFLVTDDGRQFVRYRTSWASGDSSLSFSEWRPDNWIPEGQLNLPVRGFIGFRPRPKIVRVLPHGNHVTIDWHGPFSRVRDDYNNEERFPHRYVVERASRADGDFIAVTQPAASLTAEIPDCCGDTAFFRVRMTPPPP